MCVFECVHRHVQMYVCIWYVHVVIYETATHLIFDLDFGPTFLCVCVLSWDFFLYFAYQFSFHTDSHTQMYTPRSVFVGIIIS